MRRILEAIDDHQWAFACLGAAIILILLILLGITSTVVRGAEMAVCYSRHSPADCNEELRTPSPEAKALYKDCLQEHTSGNYAVCSPILR